MSSKKKFRSKRFSSRKLVFNLDPDFDKQSFFEFSGKIIGDMNVTFESKLNRVTMNLQGEPHQIESIANQIINLETDLHLAFIGDGSNFLYSNNLIRKYFGQNVSTKLLKQIFDLLQIPNEARADAFVTPIKFDEFKIIYEKVLDLMQEIPQDHNKDIRSLLLAMRTKYEISTSKIIELALEDNLLQIKEDKLRFKKEVTETYKQLNNLLNKFEETFTDKITMKSSTMESAVDEVGFSGGKIVFIQDGKELNQSPFDINDSEEK